MNLLNEMIKIYFENILKKYIKKELLYQKVGNVGLFNVHVPC